MNEALREHVTRVGFNLTLGKTHVQTLVVLDIALKANRHWHDRGRNLFVPAVQGLERRGLVEHTYPSKSGLPVRRIWRITKAGRFVLGLLKESGLYDEYAATVVLWSSEMERKLA